MKKLSKSPEKRYYSIKNTLNMHIKQDWITIHPCPFIPLHLCILSPFCHQLLYKFSRVRRKFGVPVCFSDRNTADAKDDYLECASYQDSRFSIKQMQRDCGMQAVPRLQSSSAQTQWYASKSVHIKLICSTGGGSTYRFCQHLNALRM